MQSLQNYIFQLEDLKNNEKKYTEFIYQNLYSEEEVQELKDKHKKDLLNLNACAVKDIEKLQKENEEYKKDFNSFKKSYNELGSMHNELQKENAELKEELDNLQAELSEYE